MIFLLIFTGYWIVYWQEFITLPLYVHDYVDAKADTETMLSTGPLIVIAFTVAVQRDDAEDDRVSRRGVGNADRHDGIRNSGGTLYDLRGVCHVGSRLQ